MTIYLDLIILANLLLDYSLISYTGVIANEKINYLRLVLATLFAVSSLLLFFIRIEWLFFILRFLFSFGIIYIAFKFTTIKKYIKNIVIFYVINYLVAGIIISYDFRFFEHSILVNLKQPTTWYLLIISFLFANVLTYIYKVIEENNARVKNLILDVKFSFLNREYIVKGLIDSGNVVKSHGDNLPIVFIDKELISDDINEVFLIKHNVKFTYVMFKTIKSRYMTLAFKPDFFGVWMNNQFYEKNVYIAIGQNIHNKDQNFNMILNSNILV